MSYDKIFKNWRKDYLIEARIDKIKKRYPGNDSLIDKLSAGDPSDSDKYLGWMAKQVLKLGHTPDETIAATQGFDKNKQRLEVKDIYQWKLPDLEIALSVLGKTRKEKDEQIKSGTIKVHEDERYLLISPLTKEASCKYGLNTKWCISATETENYFDQYAFDDRMKFVFVIDKKAVTNDPHAKMALVYYPEEKMRELSQAINVPTEQIMLNPQEIFNARNKLECMSHIPDGVEIPQQAWNQMPANMTRDKLKGCENFLESHFDGKWKSFYRKKVEKVLPKIEEAMEEVLTEEAKEALEILDAIREFGEYVLRDPTWDDASSQGPFENIKTFANEYLGGLHMNYGEERRYGMRFLDKLGIRNYNEGKDFYVPAIRCDMAIDWKELGLKQVTDFTDEEKVLLSHYWTNHTARGAQEYLEQWREYEQTQPEAMEILNNMVEDKLLSRHNGSIKNMFEKAFIKVLKDLETGRGLRMPSQIFYKTPTDKERLAETYYLNPLEGSLSFHVSPINFGQYFAEWKYMKSVDMNAEGILQKAAEIVKSKETPHLKNMRQLNPNREYWFFEGLY